MVINPFKVNNSYAPIGFYDSKSNKLDTEELQDYIIFNFKEYLNENNKTLLITKIKEYLYTRYNIVDENLKDNIVSKIYNKIFGYGFLQKYIDDIKVSDIRVVKYDVVYIKEKGKWKRIDEKFSSKEEFRNYIYYCVIRNNGNISFDNPIVIVSDKKNKLRIEAGINPANAIDDSLVIRIHRINNKFKLIDAFKEYNMLDSNSYKLLQEIVNSNKNVIIAGKGGSGKTTLLRAIINEIPENLAITISEETNELYITDKNIIQREIVPTSQKDKDINLEKLLRHSLVMSNDILVVGELKGEETASFFDAISTGHIGIATLHANSVYNVLDRLIILFKRDIRYSKYSEEFIEEILIKCIDYIVFLKDYKVNEIATVEHNQTAKKVKYNIKSIYKLERQK